MAKRRVAPQRARVRVALALVAFLVVASAVIARRSVGVTRARTLHELDRQRASLAAERAKLVGDIASAQSLTRLQPLVERLGLRRPSDRQMMSLPKPVPRRGP
ncbi:MAG: hypothetical protein ACT4P7_14475 [Gemmatimonadaceae bacterium]